MCKMFMLHAMYKYCVSIYKALIGQMQKNLTLKNTKYCFPKMCVFVCVSVCAFACVRLYSCTCYMFWE